MNQPDLPLFEHGPRCACGLVGCLEALAAGPALPFPVIDTIDALARTSIAWALD